MPGAMPCDEHSVGHVVAGGTAVRARAQCSSSPFHHSMHFWLSCSHPSACSQVPQLTEGLMVLVLSAGQARAAGLAGSCRAAWFRWVLWLGGQTWAVWTAWRAGECCVMLPRLHSDPRECGRLGVVALLSPFLPSSPQGMQGFRGDRGLAGEKGEEVRWPMLFWPILHSPVSIVSSSRWRISCHWAQPHCMWLLLAGAVWVTGAG